MNKGRQKKKKDQHVFRTSVYEKGNCWEKRVGGIRPGWGWGLFMNSVESLGSGSEQKKLFLKEKCLKFPKPGPFSV